MTHSEIAHLNAEINYLRSNLTRLPLNAALTRRSTEQRLHALEARLELVPFGVRVPVRVRVTFRGKPVVGSHGVEATFGAHAVERFSRAVEALAAAQDAPLGSRGPIPSRGQGSLLVVGAALGSFGFELEEHSPPALPLDVPTPTEVAIEQAQALLQGSIGTDDELTEAASGVDARARASLREFLRLLQDSEATCAVDSGNRVTRFIDLGQVAKGVQRLGEDNLHEQELTLEGEIQGVLPKVRRFEFRSVADPGGVGVISGKLAPSIEDPDQLNKMLYQLVRAKVRMTKAGSGQPRYVLIELPTIVVSE